MATKKVFRKISKNTDDDAVKLAPQEQVVFDSIPATKAGIERAELVALLEGLASGDDPKLKTGQKPASILGYYTKHLVDSGLVEVEKIVEEKPAKQEKAA
jgi:hypothetical protein